MNSDTTRSTSACADGSEGRWLEQVVVLVEHAIDQLVLEFVELPSLHRVEHSLHCELYSLLTANRTLGRPYPLADGTLTQLVHKEWPETVVRPRKLVAGNSTWSCSTRWHWLRPGSPSSRLVKPSIAIEIGLNYEQQHLQGTWPSCRTARGHTPTSFIWPGTPRSIIPKSDGLIGAGAHIADALADPASRTHRPLQAPCGEPAFEDGRGRPIPPDVGQSRSERSVCRIGSRSPLPSGHSALVHSSLALVQHSLYCSAMAVAPAIDLGTLGRIGTALADPIRRRILVRLLDGAAYPAALAEELDTTQRTCRTTWPVCVGAGSLSPPPKGATCATTSVTTGLATRSDRWRRSPLPGECD